MPVFSREVFAPIAVHPIVRSFVRPSVRSSAHHLNGFLSGAARFSLMMMLLLLLLPSKRRRRRRREGSLSSPAAGKKRENENK
jgi:hypothetical protein